MLFSAEYPYKLSPRSYPTWANEKERQQKVSFTQLGYDVDLFQSSGVLQIIFQAVNNPCDMREKSKLMENEVASPVEDFSESCA